MIEVKYLEDREINSQWFLIFVDRKGNEYFAINTNENVIIDKFFVETLQKDFSYKILFKENNGRKEVIKISGIGLLRFWKNKILSLLFSTKVTS